MYRIRVEQTHSGPNFEFTTRAETLAGAKRAARTHKDLLCFEGQGAVTICNLRTEQPECYGSIPSGHSRLAWDN